MTEIGKRMRQFFGRGRSRGTGGEEAMKPEAPAAVTVGKDWSPEQVAKFREEWDSHFPEPRPMVFIPATGRATERAAQLLAGEKIFTDHDMRDLLTDLVQRAGSQKAVAERLGISRAYLGDVLLGRRPVSPQMAERLGWEKVEVFVSREDAKPRGEKE